ncbi:hypothetical protein FA13DRAFT_131986 [Coprinellus micaceus]|uniref:Uncharacterized protein n=1 Tax=Coprinellus micaceus TaxID=71717 RepID=A0A4Y7SHN8_COPMI|nr:hypothetical protein FA13DRAFT_131986 [Coprinellus micaceus]
MQPAPLGRSPAHSLRPCRVAPLEVAGGQGIVEHALDTTDSWGTTKRRECTAPFVARWSTSPPVPSAPNPFKDPNPTAGSNLLSARRISRPRGPHIGVYTIPGYMKTVAVSQRLIATLSLHPVISVRPLPSLMTLYPVTLWRTITLVCGAHPLL